MDKEVKEGTGIIENKEEANSKKGKYWRYKIRMNDDKDAKYPTSFSMWDYEGGSKVSVDDEVKVFWEENAGKNKVGQEVTYRNIKSIGLVKDYEPDPRLGNMTNEELVQEAPLETVKDVIQKESGERGGSPSVQTTLPQGTIAEREASKQIVIVRQSCIGYATQLASVFLTWRLEKDKDKIDLKQEWDMWGKTVKVLAKEYEEQVLRNG